MSDHQIIMSGDHPKLILEGRKTQTRRLIKSIKSGPVHCCVGRNGDCWSFTSGDGAGDVHNVRCPYGVAGDRLWVRETFALLEKRLIDLEDEGRWKVIYRADHDEERSALNGQWRPSIHMPRWASRITLEVLKVRTGRCHDITEQDALAEGIRWHEGREPHSGYRHRGQLFEFATYAYAALWDSLHGIGSWDKNPWVWIIDFRLCLVEVARRKAMA